MLSAPLGVYADCMFIDKTAMAGHGADATGGRFEQPKHVEERSIHIQDEPVVDHINDMTQGYAAAVLVRPWSATSRQGATPPSLVQCGQLLPPQNPARATSGDGLAL